MRGCSYGKLNAYRIYANALRAWKPKSNTTLTANMTNQKGADLLKSCLTANDFSGSYLISTSNKGGYGNGNSSISGNNHNRNRIYANGLREWKPKSNITLTANMTNLKGGGLLKSCLTANDISGSYLISTSNKGGYGNRNTRIGCNRHIRIWRFDKNRRGWFKPLNLSINGKWII